MGKSVREKHNLDGSVRTETSYTYKDAAGVRHSNTYVTKQSAEERQQQIQQQAESTKRALIFFLIAVGGMVLATAIILTIY